MAQSSECPNPKEGTSSTSSKPPSPAQSAEDSAPVDGNPSVAASSDVEEARPARDVIDDGQLSTSASSGPASSDHHSTSATAGSLPKTQPKAPLEIKPVPKRNARSKSPGGQPADAAVPTMQLVPVSTSADPVSYTHLRAHET